MKYDLEWRAVVCNAEYWISSNGDIISFKNSKSRVLSYKSLSQGYKRSGIVTNKKVKVEKVHALVAAAFIGPRPKGLTIDHIDCNKLNNNYKNLEYVTCAENIKRAIDNGLKKFTEGVNNPTSSLKMEDLEKIFKYIKAGKSILEVSKEIGVNRVVVDCVVRGITYKKDYNKIKKLSL